MSAELPFVVFCIEEYKNHKKMSGKDVMKLFNKYSVCEYLYGCYNALHTVGLLYIIDDIDMFIAARKEA